MTQADHSGFFPRILARSETGTRSRFHISSGGESECWAARGNISADTLTGGEEENDWEAGAVVRELCPDTWPVAGPAGRGWPLAGVPQLQGPASQSGLGKWAGCQQAWPLGPRPDLRSPGALTGSTCSPWYHRASLLLIPTRTLSARFYPRLHHQVPSTPVPVLSDFADPTFPGSPSSHHHKVPTDPTVGKAGLSHLSHPQAFTELPLCGRCCSKLLGKVRPLIQHISNE